MIPPARDPVFKDADGNMYLGTNYSLFTFNQRTKKISSLANMNNDVVMRKLVESRIVSAVRDTIDNHPALVVSPYGHFIAYYDLVEKKWISRKDSTEFIQRKFNISDNLVRKLMRSRSGKIWMANVKEGLGEWPAREGKPIRYYRNDPKKRETISNNSVYDMIEDNRSNLWVSTYGGGLNYLNTRNGKFFHIKATNNLLEGIQTDDHGNVWMISNGNLHKYDVRSQSYTSFYLPDIENSGGVKGYIYKADDGIFYMAGTNYFIALHPDSIKLLKAQPNVIFTDFKIFNTSASHLLFRNEIVLQYNQNFFSVEFSAPHFSGGGNVRYSYMLEGVDKDWVDAGTNSGSYSNITGGGYRFKVRATANPGTWSNSYATLNIVIVPPFWERWWFYVICVVLTSLIIYAVYRYRINELVKRQAMRNKIAQDLHDNVGSTLSSISIYSQVALIQSKQHNEPELHSVLDKIGSTSNEMISEMNDIVWTINPRNDNMEKILQRMESFARPLLAAKNIHFQFEYDPGLLSINLDMGKRKNLYLIFKESINNMIKYSGAEKGSVRIKPKHNSIEMVITDDGAGFDKTKLERKMSDSLSGNGLRNMALRAKEMKGLCLITSEPGKGTTVYLTFPIT